MIVFVDNINFKNENNFKSLFSYLYLYNIKFVKNTFGDNGLKKAQGNYQNLIKNIPNIECSKEIIYNEYWPMFKDELLLFLFKQEDFYLSDFTYSEKELFNYIYLDYYEELHNNFRATVFWLNYWNNCVNEKNIYICFANTLIYTKTLSSILKTKQIPLYVVEHFATGNDFYFDKRYNHLPNNIEVPDIDFSVNQYTDALKRLENWENKNVKKIESSRSAIFNSTNTFLLSTQVVNDFSIICTNREYLSVIHYYKIIIDKILKETHSNIIIKTHPYEKIKNNKSITYDVLEEYIYKHHNKDIHRIRIVENYNLEVLLDNVQCVIVFNSQIAFEAAKKGKPIITLGSPFYKGYFTIDEDITTLQLKDACTYNFNAQGFKLYLTKLMQFLYNNNDIEKIKSTLSYHQLEISIFKKYSEISATVRENKIPNNYTSNKIEEFLIKTFSSEKKYKKFLNNRNLFYDDIKSISGKILKLFFYQTKRI